jgi:hypothetical protein
VRGCIDVRNGTVVAIVTVFRDEAGKTFRLLFPENERKWVAW